MVNMTLRTVLVALAMGAAVAFTPASGRGRVRSRAMMSTNDLYAPGVQSQDTKVHFDPIPAARAWFLRAAT